MWRIGYDIHENWASVLSHANENADLSKYAAPGGWNDPDMLEVGNGDLTVGENRAHFSLWCIQAAPLILGNDPSAMTDPIKAILINREAIAIDQDSLGIQGRRIRGKGALEVWVKALKGGDKAVLLFNATDAAASIEVRWNDSLMGWKADEVADVRDIWNAKDAKGAKGGYAANVPSHDAVLLRIRNAGATGLGKQAGIRGAARVERLRDATGRYHRARGTPAFEAR